MSLPPTSGLIIEFKGKGELLSNAHGTTIVPFTCSECVLSLVPVCRWEPWEVMIWSFAVPGALRKTLAWEGFFFFFFKLPFFFSFFFIGGKLLYNILLISTKHQHESATGIHMSLPSWILPPHLPTHPTSLSYHRSLSWAPCIIQQIPTCYLFLHMVMYLFPCCSLNLSHPFLPPVSTMSSLCLCLHCCRANRLISTIFLDLCLCFFCL